MILTPEAEVKIGAKNPPQFVATLLGTSTKSAKAEIPELNESSPIPKLTMMMIAGPLAATVFAATGLSPSPNFIGLVGLLVTLQLHTRLSPRSSHPLGQLWVASTLGTWISYTSAASNALQSSILSKVLLFVLSALVSLVPIFAIFLDTRYIGKNRRFNWFRLAAFPALWASVWGILSQLSPVGRLFVWSPVSDLGPYTWVSSFLGPWGIDFIVAGWSVILTEAITLPLSQYILSIEDIDNPGNIEHFTPYTDNPDETPSQDQGLTHHVKPLFTALLLFLAIPSLWMDTLPSSTYTTTTTPFTLGCVLPQTHLPYETPRTPTLDDYIAETKKMTSAKLVLWPEGVLKFETEDERSEAFEKIANETLKGHKGFHVGIGFEEDIPKPQNKRMGKRNGFALLVDDKIALQYYKRNLVPQSFSMLPSDEEPVIYELPLGPPKGTHKSDWAEGPDYTRLIPITSSICLDFSSQSSFLSLDSRPALILAPARTWHPSVGLAMWNQARQRAHETGSTILWCDGGEGGVSGVIGGGFEEPSQFGDGSWTKTIGLSHPFPKHKTIFTSAWVGNIGAFIIVWAMTGSGLGIQVAAMVLHVRGSPLRWNVLGLRGAGHRLVKLLRGGKPRDAERGEERRLVEEGGPREAPLLDLDDDEQGQYRQQTATYGAVQRG